VGEGQRIGKPKRKIDNQIIQRQKSKNADETLHILSHILKATPFIASFKNKKRA
jgi:hypothetical protein